MNITIRASSRFAMILIILSGLITSCSQSQAAATTTAWIASPSAVNSPTIPATPTPEQLITRLASLTRTQTTQPTATKLPTSTITPTASATLIPSPTPLQFGAAAMPFIPGEPLLAAAEPIGAANLDRLIKTAQWGKGSLQRIIYSPDGQKLIAGSPYGVVVYQAKDFTTPPTWLPFPYPIFFDRMQISQDGTLLRLQWYKGWPGEGSESRVFDLRTQVLRDSNQNDQWSVLQSEAIGGFYGVSILSPDKTLRFESSTWQKEDNFNIQFLSGTFYDNLSGKELFGLKDESLYVRYNDYNIPQGCDLASFSMCGNAYDPNLMTPYRAAFSPTGRSLAILYRSTNLGNSSRFSLLRVYSTLDGSIIDTFGSFDQPVQDFAFQPNSDLLTVAYLSGSIQVWDPAKPKLVAQRWDFSPPVGYFYFSQDGRYLIVQADRVQSLSQVDVLSTRDGAPVGRYAASAIALAPHANLLALGDDHGNLQVEDLDQRKTVSHMLGHTRVIYSLAFSPDGQTLTSSSEDCTLRSWDVATGAFLHFFEKVEVDAIGEGWTKSRIFVYDMQIVPGSNQLVGFGSWGTAASWDIDSGAKQYAVISQPLEYYQGMITLDPHFPQSFWVVPEESQFYINEIAYDLKSGESIGSYTALPGLPDGCSAAGPHTMDGQLMFTPGYDRLSGQVCILNTMDQRLVGLIPVLSGQANGPVQVQQIFLSPDGTRLFVASQGGPVFIYQVK